MEFQLYQLLFGFKVETLCDNWLGLEQYGSAKSISKSSWAQEQYKQL